MITNYVSSMHISGDCKDVKHFILRISSGYGNNDETPLGQFWDTL